MKKVLTENWFKTYFKLYHLSIWRCWTVWKCRPFNGVPLHCATPIVTQGVGIFLSHPKDLPVESSFLTSNAYRRPNLIQTPKEPYWKQWLYFNCLYVLCSYWKQWLYFNCLYVLCSNEIKLTPPKKLSQPSEI